MIVMPSNNSSGIVHYLAGKYPGTLGWLLSPNSFKEPRAWLPYAIDNGAYAAWTEEREWNCNEFFDLLNRCNLSRYKPKWIAVPDVVGDKQATLERWYEFAGKIRGYGWPLAFVVQDGMTPIDVPHGADVVFVGGTTTWNWRNVESFCKAFKRVHVGRVHWIDKLEFCERVGAESCDGTGFFLCGPDSIQAEQLAEFVSGVRRSQNQMEMVA